MMKTTISLEGQLAIPHRIREQLRLEAGTEVSMDVENEALVVKRVGEGSADWRSLQGLASGGRSLTEALEAEHRAELALDDARLQDR